MSSLLTNAADVEADAQAEQKGADAEGGTFAGRK
jgi:hypothetical protein